MKRRSRLRVPRTVPGTAEDILSFVDKHGTRDKDAAGPVVHASTAKRPVERGKGGVPRMTLDLHGCRSDEASRQIRSAIESCGRRGIKELLVVHGRGLHSTLSEGPVLKGLVNDMLDNELRWTVKDFRAALPREGGEGATVLFLA
ncbi:MAG: Smr/MutS family protein [Chitinispirillaceae bacterium]|nr:Smr/MutS family protein [Chitinispirillaceae bacterium]